MGGSQIFPERYYPVLVLRLGFVARGINQRDEFAYASGIAEGVI